MIICSRSTTNLNLLRYVEPFGLQSLCLKLLIVLHPETKSPSISLCCNAANTPWKTFLLPIKKGSAMKCENDFCIYQHCGICMLGEITINSLGMCEQCIIISLNENDLTQAKAKTLDRLEDGGLQNNFLCDKLR